MPVWQFHVLARCTPAASPHAIPCSCPAVARNYKTQSVEALSPWFLAEWLLGDTFNLLGGERSGGMPQAVCKPCSGWLVGPHRTRPASLLSAAAAGTCIPNRLAHPLTHACSITQGRSAAHRSVHCPVLHLRGCG